MPERTHKDATRKLRLTADDDAALVAAADARGMGASEYIRRAVATQIARDRAEADRVRVCAELDRQLVGIWVKPMED